MRGESLEEFVARLRSSSLTDPTWRCDYRDPRGSVELREPREQDESGGEER